MTGLDSADLTLRPNQTLSRPSGFLQGDVMILDEALRLHGQGLCVIPIRPKSKKPALPSWKEFQSERPTEAKLREWFGGGTERGLAVVFGDVSGGLVCRDFDSIDAYNAWAEAYPEAAQTLPQSETSRGRHVFCRVAESDAVSRLNPSGGSIIDFGDGELRGAGYSVLPPSVHESGHVYRWLIPLVDPIPIVDLKEVGFDRPWSVDASSELPSLPLFSAHFTEEDIREPKSTEVTEEDRSHDGVGGSQAPPHPPPMTSVSSVSSVKLARSIDFEPILDDITRAIAETLPTGEGQRNKALFRFTRKLKGIPALADADPNELRSIVLRWHEAALPFIRTQSPEETQADFIRGWPKVKHPAGVLRRLLDEALAESLPACCKRYPTPAVKRLIALCRKLSHHWQPKPFPLACRSAGELLRVSHTTANSWLFLLTEDGIIELVETGSQKTRRASRYFYRGD